MRHPLDLHDAARPAGATSLAELVGAFSYALDITEGQPAGHCVRACWIGSRVGRAIGLAPEALISAARSAERILG